MEIRKSGKIAVGIIAAMGTIGALHVFVFRNSAAEYQQAKDAYNGVLGQYTQQGTAPNINEIYRFRYESLKYKLEFWQTIDKLKIALPDYVDPAGGTFTIERQRQTYWDLLVELEKRRDEGEAGTGPKLPFLGPGANSWNLSKTLPQKFENGKVAVDDELTTLRNENQLLKALTVGTAAYLQREAEYKRRLFELGLNLIERDGTEYRTPQGTVATDGKGITDRFGSAAAAIMTVNRIDRVLKKLQPDFFAGKSDDEKRLEMYELFRIKWPKDYLDNEAHVLVQRQGEALLRMIEIAKEEKVEQIISVKFVPPIALSWVDPEKAAMTPTLAVVGAFDEGFMGGGGDPTMMGEGGGGEFGGKGGYMGAVPAATPAVDITASGTPIEIAVQGTNSSVMAFLYRLTHETVPFEVDRLRIRVAPKGNANEESKVQALFYVNVVASSVFLGLQREIDVKRKIVEAEIELAEVAMRPGAREAALRDGVINMDGGNPKLTKETPTPFPTPTPNPNATPVPPPPPVEGAPPI